MNPQDQIFGGYFYIQQSALNDAAFDVQAHLKSEFEAMARAHYSREDYTYTYLSPQEYEYTPGPFMYRQVPGDLPEGVVMMVGRVRVQQLTPVIE